MFYSDPALWVLLGGESGSFLELDGRGTGIDPDADLDYFSIPAVDEVVAGIDPDRRHYLQSRGVRAHPDMWRVV